MGAMVEGLGRHGYEKVTVAELVALAGVSNRDFYRLFSSKEECFLATFEEILKRTTLEVRHGYRQGASVRERMLSAVSAFAELITANQAVARVALVDALSLGTAPVALREGVEEEFAELARHSFAEAPELGEFSDVAIRGMIGGARRVVYEGLRSGQPKHYREHAQVLFDWALGYGGHKGKHVLEESVFVPVEPGSIPLAVGARGTEVPWWREPPSSALSKATLTVRERIVRAAAQVAASRGYASLSVPAITAVAGTSNQTFYREFKDKREAFLEAFDGLAERALGRAVASAFGEPRPWPEPIGAVLTELLAFIGRNPSFARIAFFELAAAGPEGLDRAEQATRPFTALLSPEALPDEIEPLPEVVTEAIGGGVWVVIEQEVAHGRAESLPKLAQELTDFVLVPFGIQA